VLKSQKIKWGGGGVTYRREVKYIGDFGWKTWRKEKKIGIPRRRREGIRKYVL